MDSQPSYDWWKKDIQRVRELPGRVRLQGFWMSPRRYRFTHPVTRRTQDMFFEHPERHDPEDLNKLIRAQEGKALMALSSPMKDRKVGKYTSVDRSLTEIDGREIAVKERWY